MADPRKLFLLICLPSALMLSACDTDYPTAPADEVPNILVIVTDDQPMSGSLRAMTATREHFVKEGTRWSNAFATTPSCCPSRASIFTGQYAHNHGVTSNNENQVDDLDHDDTIQRRLQEADYFTGIVGKYLNKWNLANDPPYFDRWAIHPGAQLNRNYYYDGPWNVDGDERVVHEYSTQFVTSRALDFLNQAEGQDDPWFLYVAPLAPHADFDEPPLVEPKFKGAHIPKWQRNPAVDEADLSDKPSFVREVRRPASSPSIVRRRQLRSLMSVDALVDQLFDQLEESGEDENTLAIFLSDNGYLWGEHGLVTKLYPYTPSVRIPLLVRWPGHVPAAKTDRRLVANLDVAPTLAAAAGLPPDSDVDGHSLLDPDWSRRRILLEGWGWSYVGLPRWASIRTKSAQYIEYQRGNRVTAREYYRLKKDPWQLRNAIHSAGRSRVEKLAGLLDQERDCRGSECP